MHPVLAAVSGCCAGDKMQFARRVGLDMYRFLEGFATQASGDAILIPTNALDRYRPTWLAAWSLVATFCPHVNMLTSWPGRHAQHPNPQCVPSTQLTTQAMADDDTLLAGICLVGQNSVCTQYVSRGWVVAGST